MYFQYFHSGDLSRRSLLPPLPLFFLLFHLLCLLLASVRTGLGSFAQIMTRELCLSSALISTRDFWESPHYSVVLRTWIKNLLPVWRSAKEEEKKRLWGQRNVNSVVVNQPAAIEFHAHDCAMPSVTWNAVYRAFRPRFYSLSLSLPFFFPLFLFFFLYHFALEKRYLQLNTTWCDATRQTGFFYSSSNALEYQLCNWSVAINCGLIRSLPLGTFDHANKRMEMSLRSSRCNYAFSFGFGYTMIRKISIFERNQ